MTSRSHTQDKKYVTPNLTCLPVSDLSSSPLAPTEEVSLLSKAMSSGCWVSVPSWLLRKLGIQQVMPPNSSSLSLPWLPSSNPPAIFHFFQLQTNKQKTKMLPFSNPQVPSSYSLSSLSRQNFLKEKLLPPFFCPLLNPLPCSFHHYSSPKTAPVRVPLTFEPLNSTDTHLPGSSFRTP